MAYNGNIYRRQLRIFSDHKILLKLLILFSCRREELAVVRSFETKESVTGLAIFNVLTIEVLDASRLVKTLSVVADTTSVNTGSEQGVNTRLQTFFSNQFGINIHVLECLFHINELLLTHVLDHVEGKTTGPGRRPPGSAYNLIPSIEKSHPSNMKPQVAISQLGLSISTKAKLSIRTKIYWYTEKKESREVGGILLARFNVLPLKRYVKIDRNICFYVTCIMRNVISAFFIWKQEQKND